MLGFKNDSLSYCSKVFELAINVGEMPKSHDLFVPL